MGPMEAVALLWRARLRRRWRAWLTLAVLLGLGAGAGLSCLAGARRTASSFGRIAAATDEPDINSSHGLPPAEAEAVANSFAGVARHGTIVGFIGFAEGVDPTLVRSFFGPWDRPLTGGLPLLRAGRHPDPDRADEVLVTSPRAEAAGVTPGMRLTVRLLRQDGGEPEATSVVVTGIGAFAIDVATDTAYDRSAIIFTPAFTRANAHLQAWSATALTAAPGTDVKAELVPQLQAVGWSTDEVHSVTRSRVQDALRPLTATLGLLGALVLSATMVVTAQALARQRDVAREDRAAIRAMGFSPGQSRALDAVSVLSVAGPGAVLAVATALALSPLFPVGSVRRLEPSRGLSIDVTVLALGALAVVGLLLVTSRLGSRGQSSPVTSPAPPRLGFLGRLGPSAGAGVRQAVGATAEDRRRFGATVALTAVAVGLLVGGVVFVAALDRLSADPRLYGVGWDLTARNAYGDVDPEALGDLLAGDPDLKGVTGADLSIVLLDERLSVPTLAVLPITASLWPTVVEGRVPRTDDEVLVGTAVLEEMGAEIGDSVLIRLAFGPESVVPAFPVTIAGTAVFPSVELAGFDPTRLGTGVAVTWDRYLSLQPPDEQYTPLPDLTFLDLADGVDPRTVIARYADGLPETSGFSTTEWLPSLAPAEVRETEQATTLIWTVIAFLGLTVIATIASALAATVRRRRRDYAILKALGLSRGQVRATVAWQAVAPVALALVVGLPLGIVGGRWVWRLFTHLVGVIDTPVVPLLPIGAVVLGALAAAGLVALGPGIRAARVPALTLHLEK